MYAMRGSRGEKVGVGAPWKDPFYLNLLSKITE